MASKIVEYSSDARSQLKNGVDKLANAVKVTLGPKGRNVIIDKKFGAPTVTKDGVSVAKEIELENPVENMGAQMVREVASKTSDVAGDGTTTATVLAQAIYREGLKNVTAGANPMDLKRGIDLAVVKVIEFLKTISKEVGGREEIAQVGSISANNDKTIGNLIADAMEKVGKDGVITVEESKSAETSLEVVEGMQFSEFFEIDFSDIYAPPDYQSGKNLFIADLHLPFHHVKHLRATLENNQDAETLIIDGDFFDIYSLSHWRKTKHTVFKDEFRNAYLELKDICRRFPKVKLLVANHDNRFSKWLYDNAPNEILPFCHTKIIEDLVSLLPNVEIISQKIVTDGGSRNVNYAAQYKNVIFTHIEKSNIDITKTAQEIYKSFKAKWDDLYGFKDYDILIQAHNHSAGDVWVNNTKVCQVPCLIDITQYAFDYVFNGKFAGNPPALGYITCTEKDNYIDPNSLHIFKFRTY